MAQFRDGRGREWAVAIDVFLLEKVAEIGVRLDQLYADQMKGLIALLNEPVKLVRVLWILLEEQAEKSGVSPEQFGRAMHGDALDDAAVALQAAAADFAPRRQRSVLKALAAKSVEVADHMTATAVSEVTAIDPASVVELFRTRSGSATSSPASSGSTPAPAG